MIKLHFIMGHKGGIGKTWCAEGLLEYFLANNRNSFGFDTDAANRKSALSAFKALPVTLLNLIKNKAIDSTEFDKLVEDILVRTEDAKGDVDVVIDIGASSHVEFERFAFESDLFETLKQEGIECYLHCPIVGGDMYAECIAGLVSLVQNFPTTPIYVWKNTVHGEVISPTGKTFEETKAFTNYAEHYEGIINLPIAMSNNFKSDFAKKSQWHLTYNEVFQNSKFKITERSRMKRFWNDFQLSLQAVGV